MADNVIRHDIIQLDLKSDAFEEIKKLRKELDDLKKKLTGGVGEDEFDKTKDSVEKTRKEIEKTTRSTGKLGQALKTAARVSFKALAVGLGATATAIGAIVKQSVAAYAEFEQLKGGMETLMGAKGAKNVQEYAKLVNKSVDDVKAEYKTLAESEKLVMKNANNAWKTTGMSANDYMTTVTSFAASLKTSLGDGANATLEAAKLADVAMQDMADNANKMGTPLENVSIVYSNLARGMYMTLDNLKLGYAGTKEGAKQMVNDAAKIDKSVKKNDLSYANLVKAIHAVQVKMDIYGTTGKEAEKTITGSLNAMKSAWGNLLPALIQGGDSFDQCVKNLVESVKTFYKNIKPAILSALSGVGNLIEELAPMVEESFPTLVDELLPPLIKAATSLLKSLIIALPSIVKTIAKEIPFILKEVGLGIGEAFGLDQSVIKKFSGGLETVGQTVKKFVPALIGLVGAFKLLSKVKAIGGGLAGLFGGGSVGSNGLLSGIKSFAKASPKTILKGMANLAIVLGGLALMAGVLMEVAPEMAKLSDMKSVLKVVAVVGVLGVLGTALAKLGQIAGKIPVSTVAKGLANMAIMIGGLTVVGAAFAYFADEIAGLASIKSMLEVAGIITVLGAVGSALSIFAGIAGVIPFPVVLSGLANMALVIGGMEAILVALGALNKIKGFKGLVESGGELLAITFKALGKALGSLVAGLAEGVTSTLPAIGKNIAGFVDSLGTTDFTVLSNFFNALSAIKGVPSTGGLVQLFTGDPYTGLLKMAAILPMLGLSAKAFMANVGGITDFTPISSLLDALTNVKGMPNAGGFFQLFTGDPYSGLLKMISILPSLGTSVGAFFANVGGITDFSPISSLLNALASVSAMPEAGGFFQFFTGDPYSGLLKLTSILPSVGTAIGTFFANLGGVTDFTPISRLFNTLASVKELPKAGGFAQFFTGSPYAALAALIVELPPLGTAVGEFFANLGKVTDFSLISKLFNTLATVKALPKAGGFAQFFTGDPYKALGAMIIELPLLGKAVQSFYTSLEGIDDFSKITNLFKTLGGLDGLVGKDGGLFKSIGKLFTGSKESAIYKLGASLKSFGEQTKGFFSQVNDFNAKNFNSIFTSLASLEEKISKLKNTAESDFKAIVAAVTINCAAALTVLKTTLKAFKTVITTTNLTPAGARMMDSFLTGINSRKTAILSAINSITASIGAKLNSVIKGGNHTLSQFGSDKTLSTYSYAGGTSGHRGGNAIVNDGRGAELVQMPNGNTFIPQGRNVFLPNAPKGMKVLDAQRTAQLLGKGSPTFRYAGGTGDLDVLSYDKGDSLANAIVKKFVDYTNTSGYALTAGKAAVNTVKGAMSSWGDKLIEELGAKGLGDYVASAGVEQWRSTVTRALKMEGQYSAANVKRTLYQMQTESGGNPRAINLWDSNAKKGIPSKGLMQVIDPTFRAYARKGFNKNIYDPLSNILASVRYATSRYGTLAKAYRGVGYSQGVGTVRLPTNENTWKMAYTPESDSSYYSSSNVENNNYSPQFVLNLSGTVDRTTERTVKRWIKEALEDTFDGISRTNPRLTEA